MKKLSKISIMGLLTLFSISLKAQVILPYNSGFDNVFERSGWLEFKKAATSFSHWSFSTGGYSGTNCVSHSYSPSTGITLTDNWFVSPAFLIPGGGKLDSIRYKFSGFSMPQNGDTIAIYLLNGSPDPSLATTKLLLFDFRDNNYIADDSFRKKTNINLPSLSGPCFLAIRYRNSDCSSKWLTVSFDNIAISSTNSSINEPIHKNSLVKVYPNPAILNLTVETDNYNFTVIEILDLAGHEVFMSNFKNFASIDISDFPKGVYFLMMKSENDTEMFKFIKY